VSIAGLNIVICHGDAQCTDDTDYKIPNYGAQSGVAKTISEQTVI
jgi:UDP-2,3-diacylglucosamine pyrophosphatase LpxH